MTRIERDSVGEMAIADTAYYGVNAARAQENFKITDNLLDTDFIISLAEIKQACAQTNRDLGVLEPPIADAIIKACDDIINGKLHDQFIIDPLQGGAGTSSNMNANEVIANRAIEYLGGKRGDYSLVHPNDHVNKGQSTNDVYPSAGKLTLLKKVPLLLAQLDYLESILLQKAERYQDVMKLGRTQLNDAVALSVGAEIHAYYTVISRNHQRIINATQELLRINLGGTAIGTGLNSHPDFPKVAAKKLSAITDFNFLPSQDLIDGTQNVESYAVLADQLKTLALSLSKIANDIRLLSSGPLSGIGEYKIPAKQNGSSIMPGKINPVIPEIVNQCAFAVIGNNTTISMAVEAGQLELNAFEPVIFYKLLESFQYLTRSIDTFVANCLVGLEPDADRCQANLEHSTSLATDLSKVVGYSRAAKIAKETVKSQADFRQVAIKDGIPEQLVAQLHY